MVTIAQVMGLVDCMELITVVVLGADYSVDLVSILLARFTKQRHTWSDKLIVTKVRIPIIRLIKFSVYLESKSQTEGLNYSPE